MLTLRTDTSTPDLVAELLTHNAQAMALSRRGPCGTLSAEYAAIHASINALLFKLVR